MNIADYFNPVQDLVDSLDLKEDQLGLSISYLNESNVENFKLAILGVGEQRNAYNNAGCEEAPNEVRKYLYQLTGFSEFNTQIIDLGNFRIGENIADTYFALSEVMEYLLKLNVLPVVIGGSQDLTYANFLAYKNMEQTINLVAVDAKLNLGKAEDGLNSENYLTKIMLHQPNYLFNFSHIGYQSYFVSAREIELMNKLFFDIYRLGQVQQNLEEVEPIVRNADILSFDITAIRQSEAGANKNASPNGFYGEQACQIARYAGLSDKLTSIGFYEVNPSLDTNGQTAHLTAQMIWYFMDGVMNRKADYPAGSRKSYLKYNVNLQEGKNEVIFYKSDKSERWWMEVPYPSHEKIKFERHLLVPCSYKDYETACANEMPNRWWQTFQKLS